MKTLCQAVKICWQKHWLCRVTIVMVCYSLGIAILAYTLGVHWGFDFPLSIDTSGRPAGPWLHFKGYWQRWNWMLFPLYWPIICGLVYLTWDGFGKAWKGLRRAGVLKTITGASESGNEIRMVFRELEKYRRRAIIPIVLLAIGLVILDALNVFVIYKHHHKQNELGSIYTNYGPSELTLTNHQKLDDRHALVYAIVDTNTLSEAQQIPENKRAARLPLNGNLELNFTIGSYIPKSTKSDSPNWQAVGEDGGNAILSRRTNISFDVLVYVQEVVIGTLALLALYQVCVQCFVFWFFRSIRAFREAGLRIRLKHDSPLYEFGLESWNHALNNVYWIFSVALLIPIISRRSQSATDLDSGQWIFQILVPILIAAPMLISIIGRQQMLPLVNADLLREIDHNKTDAAKNEKTIERFHAQRLWPLDKNWVSKLGILIAFLLLSFLLGLNLLTLASSGSG